MAVEVRTPEVGDADALGRVHVRAWQAAYTGGLMPDEYLDSLAETDRASMSRASLEDPPRARATRLLAAVDNEVFAGTSHEHPNSTTSSTTATYR